MGLGIKGITENIKNALTNKDLGGQLMESIDKGLKHPQRSDAKGRFFVSAIGQACDRYLWLHYNGRLPWKDVSANLQRIFGVGSAAEERWEKYFEKAEGISMLGRELKARIETPFTLSGRADFQLAMDGKLFILELKTINQRGWDDDIAQGPKSEHSTQLQCYLNILNQEQGVLLYENKNNQMVKTFVVRRSDDLWNNILARGQKIIDMAAPPRMADVARIHPSYCDCKGVSDKELGIG